MSHDTMPPRMARRLTISLLALVIASMATAATAAGALAGKEPPTVLFRAATPACVYDNGGVSAVVDIGFEGHGRWVRVEAWAIATDADGKETNSGTLFVGEKYDMRAFTPTIGLPLSTANGPVTTEFWVRPVDRNGVLLAPWEISGRYTCNVDQ